MIEWCLLFCVCVCVFVLPCSTECDSLRDRDTDGCVTHATPINPKTHRNLAKRRAWEGWREGRGGDLSSLQTVSFDSEQEELGQMAPKPYQPPRKKKRKKKKKLHFSAGWNLEHSISLLHAAQSGQCVFPRISLMSGSAPKASGAQIYRMWIVSFCQINCSLNQKLLSIFLSLTSIVIRLYPRCFKVSNLSPPVFTFNWILCSKNSK